MKVEYFNLYTHFIFTTLNRFPLIEEKNRVRIEKYITGVVNNNDSKLYSIYANPEQVHILISRSPKISEELLATIIADSSEGCLSIRTDYPKANLHGSNPVPPFLFRKQTLIKFVSIFRISRNITRKSHWQKNMIRLSAFTKEVYAGNS